MIHKGSSHLEVVIHNLRKNGPALQYVEADPKYT